MHVHVLVHVYVYTCRHALNNAEDILTMRKVLLLWLQPPQVYHIYIYTCTCISSTSYVHVHVQCSCKCYTPYTFFTFFFVDMNMYI